MRDIRQWLDALGLGQYADAFEDNAIEFDQLATLTDEELKELGVAALGHRKRIRERAVSPAAPNGASAEGFTGDDLAQRIIASRSAADGERKHVTVLFADLCGSTALIERLGAEAAVERVQPALDAMRKAVQRYEGTVNRVQGDGIMALFGAPIAHEDHALRACLAGLEIRDAISRLGDDALVPRIGLNSGEAVVRSIRNDLTVDYEADGPAVHVAARMEQLAEPGTVRVTRHTWRLVDGHIEARPLGAPPVRGVAEPLPQYELVRPSGTASRWEGRARRGLTRFVGREGEMAVLQEAAAEAATGHGQVVALVGEAGMGKSRLLHEFLRSPGVRQWTVRVAAATPHGRNTPYLPLKQLLRELVGAAPQDDARTVAEQLGLYLGKLAPELAVLQTPLQALLELEVSDDGWWSLAPAMRRRRIVEAVRELALSRARDGPLLFVVEDLHWIDAETQEVLDRMVESLGAASLFLLVTCRPEYRQQWYGKSYFVPVHVGPIPASRRAELLDELLGTDASLGVLKSDIEQRSEGGPLYIEEIVRALAEQGTIAGARGHYRLIRSDTAIPIPDTIQAVIGARIDRLEPGHKRLLQVASVLGRVVPYDLLKTVAAVDEAELQSALSALQAAELVFETRSFPTSEYMFKHALIESVVYDSLLRRQRRALHEAALRASEARYAARIGEQAELLAYHAKRAELWPEAIRYFRQAGNKAVANSAYREATEHFEQALSALDHLPRSEEALSMAIDIRFEMRPPLGALAQYRNLFARLTEARSLAGSIGDRRREAVIGADMTHVLYHLGDVEQALEVGEQAARAARDVGDPRVLVQAASNSALARVCKGEFRRAVEIAEPFARELKSTFRHERLGTTGTSACIWLGNLCGSNALVGDFARAIDHGEEACRIARETGLPFDRAMSSTWLAFGLMLKGETERSIPRVEEALELVRENELDFLLPWSLMVCVGSHAIAHHPDRALSVLEEAAVQRERLPSLVLLWIWFGAAEAMAFCESGQYERAAALCAEQLTTIARQELRTFEAPVRRTLGLCIARGAGDAGDIDAARAALTGAREVATSQGALPEVAHANLALAELSAEQGDLADARSLAGSALAAYTRMGMTRWRADAEAILASS